MAFVAAAIVGGSLISGGLGYLASQQASSAQVGAEQQALAAQNQARGQLQPFINVGTGATNILGGLYGIGANGQQTTAPVDYSNFYNTPDYQFALQQGNLGVQRYENAAGLALSGGALKDVAQFNQGLASQQFGNYFNRLMQLGTLGGNAAQAGVGGANAAAGTIGAIGQSQASGIIGGTNAIIGGVNSGISNALLYNGIQNQQQQNALLQASMNRSSYAGPMNLTPYAPSPFASAGSASGGLY